jgi:flavoprotein
VTQPAEGRVLYVIVCGAGPAGDVGRLVDLAHDRGWTVQIIATPSALPFIDVPKLEAQTGRTVRSEYRSPGEPKSAPADAIIVAPATYNTINKWANGISDTYALGILAEAPGLGIPVVALPFVNSGSCSGLASSSRTHLEQETTESPISPGNSQLHQSPTSRSMVDLRQVSLTIGDMRGATPRRSRVRAPARVRHRGHHRK